MFACRKVNKVTTIFLITLSGYSSLDLESQALVVQRTAIEIGIAAYNREILPIPNTTSHEIQAFVSKLGKTKNVIAVSDATHLLRALMLYKKAGITAILVPANFMVKKGCK